jgi:hypothetical protein
MGLPPSGSRLARRLPGHATYDPCYVTLSLNDNVMMFPIDEMLLMLLRVVPVALSHRFAAAVDSGAPFEITEGNCRRIFRRGAVHNGARERR